MKKLLFLLLFIPLVSFGQSSTTFKNGKSVNVSKLYQELVDVIGESNDLISQLLIDDFNKCFFDGIAKRISYSSFKADLIKSKNRSDNLDYRMSYLYNISYIKEALWDCIDTELIEELSKSDEIRTISNERVEIIALEHLKELKRELGIFQYVEIGRTLDWKLYSECYIRKLWSRLTPKEMSNPNKETEMVTDLIMDECMNESKKIKNP